VPVCPQVIEPAYQMLSFYLRHLAVSCACPLGPLLACSLVLRVSLLLRVLSRAGADDDLPKGREREVPGLREIFGSENSQLPGKVIR
jgi:hypothetical protein